MMKEKEDMFSKFRNSFSKIDGHFHILEQRVPVETQIEYFKYSEQIKKERQNELTDIEFETFTDNLKDAETSTEYKRYILSCLAVSRQVRAYRVLESYTKNSSEETHDWACLAHMESRISLESELSNEKQIYISTGLGGKGEKLRFYIMLPAKRKEAFTDLQRQIIEQEFNYYLQRDNCDVERITICDLYVELILLIPVRANIKFTLDSIINECNLYGNFLYDRFTITNVKELSEEDVNDILEKTYGNNYTSFEI